MGNALDILAATSSTSHTAPAPMLLVAYIIWCWRRTPSPGSTRALDGWAGFLSANFCVVGFWMKRRWALGFLWLAIWAVVIGIQRILAATLQFQTEQAGNAFDTISIISLLLMGWTTGIFALKTPRLARVAAAAHQPPPPIQADLIVAKALDEEKQTSGIAAAPTEPPPPQASTATQQHAWFQSKQAKVLGFLLAGLMVIGISILFWIGLMIATTKPSEQTQAQPPPAPPVTDSTQLAKANTYHVDNCEELGLLMEPDYKSPILARLQRGLSGIIALGDVTEKGSTRWQRVVTPAGRQGWVDSGFLLPDQESAAAALQTATPNQGLANRMTLPKVKLNTYHVDKCDMLNVRTDPDSTSPIVVRLNKEVSGIIVFGDIVTNGSTRWQKVITPAGRQGWVNTDFLVPDPDVAH